MMVFTAGRRAEEYGFWALKIADSHICYGNWAYYFLGYKVFYSFKFQKTTKTNDEVIKTIDIMKQLGAFCPSVYNIDKVNTNVKVGGRQYNGTSPAINMQHVYYPERAWLKFAKGKPYDWTADNHPNHSEIGFKRFRSELEKATEDIDYNFDSFSIGNIVWCTEQKRWYLVDVR